MILGGKCLYLFIILS